MKSFKVMAVGMLVLGAMAMSGCGGDKYVGQWYKSDGPKATDYQQLDIQKNGSGYIINSNTFRHAQKMTMLNRKEHEASKRFRSPFMTGRDYGEAMKKIVPPIYDVDVQWTKYTGNKYTGTMKDDRIILDSGGKMVYIGKDNTLLYNGKTYKSEKDFKPKNVQMQLRKKIEAGLEEMKDLKNKISNPNEAPVIQKVEIKDELATK